MMIPDPKLFEVGEESAVRGVRVLRSGVPGPVVGLMGMLHGNEPAGTGLWRFAKELGRPARGEVHVILGHPDAVAARPGGVRYIQDDLNRMFLDDAELIAAGVDLAGPDYRRKVELMEAVAPLDVLVDIHTTSQPSAPFAIGYTANPEARRLSQALPAILVDGLHQFIRGTACQWLLDRGKAAITVEVGSHLEPTGPDRAFRVAHRILDELDMLPQGRFPEMASKVTPGRRIVVGHHVPTVGREFRYARHFENFDRLEPGEIIGEDENQIYRTPTIDNPVIFMPAAEATLRDGSNTDAFFFGVEVGNANAADRDQLAQTA